MGVKIAKMSDSTYTALLMIGSVLFVALYYYFIGGHTTSKHTHTFTRADGTIGRTGEPDHWEHLK